MAISRKGLRRIVVDGVEYYWRADAPYAGPLDITVIAENPTRTMRLAIPARAPRDQRGWWIDLRVKLAPALVARVIRLAARRPGNTRLTIAEVIELLDRDRPRPEDRLRDLATALDTRSRHALVAALLALGCHGDRGELIDDWFACNAHEVEAARGELQAIADEVSSWRLDEAAEARSAIAFAVDFNRRVGTALAIDTDLLDTQLAKRIRTGPPWGIPPEHDWW